MEEKKVREYSTNRFILPLLFIVFSLLLEMANFLYFGFRTPNGSRMFMPTYFLFDFAVVIMLAALIFVFQKKWLIFAVFCAFLAVQTGVNVANVTLYALFGEVLSIDSLKLGTEAAAAFSFDLIDWGGTMLNLCMYAAMVAIAVVLMKYNKTTYKVKFMAAPLLAVAIFILIEAFGTGFYEIQIANLNAAARYENEIEYSDQYLWRNFQFKLEAYKKFGFFGFYTKGIFDVIEVPPLTNEDEQKYIRFIDNGYVEGDSSAPLYGDNLIVVLLESVDLFAIDPIYTPTLWKMWSGENSISFKSFYARNRTNNSEGITLLGSMPRNTYIKDSYNKGYQFAYSLPHLFERGGDENVKTTYVHTNTRTFYNRDVTHGDDGVGFDSIVSYEDYTGEQKNDKWGNWIFDENFIRNVIDKILPENNERFLTYFTTLSTHGPWYFEKEYFTDYYKYYDEHLSEYTQWLEEQEFVYPNEENVREQLRNFKVGTIDLDNTIKYLLEELDNRGLADNTSIYFFADHNAYYHDLCFSIKGVKKSDISNTYANHIPSMLYSPKLVKLLTEQYSATPKEGIELVDNGIIVNTFCNTYDILPTICDLYGLESNTNMFPGYSIFSDEIENSFFSSHLGGMFTDKIYSQNITEIYIRGQVDEDEITRFRNSAIKFFEKQEALEKIYRYGINGTKIKFA